MSSCPIHSDTTKCIMVTHLIYLKFINTKNAKKKKNNDNIKGERMLEFRTCAFNYVELQSKVSATKVPLSIAFMQMVTL